MDLHMRLRYEIEIRSVFIHARAPLSVRRRLVVFMKRSLGSRLGSGNKLYEVLKEIGKHKFEMTRQTGTVRLMQAQDTSGSRVMIGHSTSLAFRVQLLVGRRSERW